METVEYTNTQLLEEIQALRERVAQLEGAVSETSTEHRLYRDLFDQCGQILLVIDAASGQIVQGNAAAHAYYGHPEHALTTLTMRDIIVESADLVCEAPREPYSAGHTRSRCRHRLAGGEVREVEVTSGPVEWQGRSLILSAVYDISVRAAFEEALERERAFLATAIDVIPLPLALLSPTGKVLRANRAMANLLRQPGLEMISDIILLDPLTYAPLPEDEQPHCRALRERAPVTLDGIIVLPDGREVPGIGYAAPIEVNGEIAAVVIAFQDLSDLKDADRAKDEFLAVLSHELLTPLTSVLGWSQFAQQGDSVEMMRQALAVIERNAWRQKRLVDEILDVSRITHRKLHIDPEPLELWQVVQQCVEGIEQAAAERRLDLTAVAPLEALPVCADPARLGQAVTNLLTNALRYTDPGGTVRVAAWRKDDTACVAVSDTGRGIPAEKLSQLFIPFQQLQRDQTTGGLGIGLAVVKGIVELHHGTVGVESPGEGKGSTFTICLPVRSGD